jgi:hypothetical protein
VRRTIPRLLEAVGSVESEDASDATIYLYELPRIIAPREIIEL